MVDLAGGRRSPGSDGHRSSRSGRVAKGSAAPALGRSPHRGDAGLGLRIVSPSNAAYDRVRKRRLYAEHAVPFFWLVDPAARTLEALRWDPATKTWADAGAYDEGAIARIAPFEGIELEVGRLFPPSPQVPPA